MTRGILALDDIRPIRLSGSSDGERKCTDSAVSYKFLVPRRQHHEATRHP